MSILERRTVYVTKKHIDEGDANDCSTCPVALAIKDLVKPEAHVGFDYDHIVLNHESRDYMLWRQHRLPHDSLHRAFEFAKRFDSAQEDCPWCMSGELEDEDTGGVRECEDCEGTGKVLPPKPIAPFQFDLWLPRSFWR